MDSAIQALITAYRRYRNVERDMPNLLQHLKTHFGQPAKPLDQEEVKVCLRRRNALAKFRKLPQTSLNYKYSMFLLSVRPRNDLSLYIKALALGFRVPHGESGLCTQILEWRRAYLSLKSFKGPNTIYHAHFFEHVKAALLEYENEVVRSSRDPLAFFANVYPTYLKLELMEQLNTGFDPNLLFEKPFSVLEVDLRPLVGACVRDFIRGKETQWELSCIEPKHAVRIKIIAACLKLAKDFGRYAECGGRGENRCPITRSACPYTEARDWNADGGSTGYVHKHASGAIGECRVASAQWGDDCPANELHGGGEEGQCTCRKLCTRFSEELDALCLDGNFSSRLIFLLGGATVHLTPLLEHLRMLLLFLKRTFLFFRSDFVQCMFTLLRDLPFTKHSFVFTLDSALGKTIKKDPLNSQIDIVLLDTEDQWNYFSIFFKMKYPISLLMTKADKVELSQIFRHLWRIKKAEVLLVTIRLKRTGDAERLRIIPYLDLIFKLKFYVFYEVIEKEYSRILGADDLLRNATLSGAEFLQEDTDPDPLHGLRTKVRDFLSAVHRKTFMEKGIRDKLLLFLEEIEQMCKGLAKTNFLDDTKAKSALDELFNHIEVERGTQFHEYLNRLAL